jgi:hypothetical protein
VKALYFTLACVALACGGEDADVPQFYHGTLPENPRTCGDVRDMGENEDGKVLIDGAPAECVGEGVTCSVADLPAFDGECSIGLPNAVCVTQHWAIRCDLDSGSATPVDGGDGG